MGAPLPSSGALDWGAWYGTEALVSLGGNFAAEISLQGLIYNPWEQGQPFSCLHASYQSQYGFSCKPLVMTSIPLTSSWLFRLVVLYFTCNSSLALGGGECNIHLVCHHRGFLHFSFQIHKRSSKIVIS